MIKKLISSVLIILMLVSTLCLAAKPGDVAGNYFYTDIKTYMRGQLLDSFNVGGKTVILCEALRDYGFNVSWDGVARKLTVVDIKGNATSNATGAANGAIGTIAGDYYHTDIVTVFNGVEFESYNIGGQTAIPATDLRNLGYDVVWDEANRRVLIDTNPNTFVSGTDEIDNVTVKEQQFYHGTYVMRTDAVSFNGMQLVTDHDCFIETSVDKKNYVPFKAFADCLGISYSWNSATSTLAVNVPSDKEIKAKNSRYKSTFKTYGTIDYEIKDIVFNIVNGNESFNDLAAIVYGTEVFVDSEDLGKALGFYCLNGTDFYTETMAYYMYMGMTGASIPQQQ